MSDEPARLRDEAADWLETLRGLSAARVAEALTARKLIEAVGRDPRPREMLVVPVPGRATVYLCEAGGRWHATFGGEVTPA